MKHPNEKLSEYVDEELDAAEAREIEAHLAACAECRTTVDGLREVVKRARSLRDVTPDVDVWPAIEARLEPRQSASVRQCAPRRWQVTLSLPQLAAAAVLLMAVSAGSAWMLQMRRAAAPAPSIAAAPQANRAAVRVAAGPMDLGDESYDKAIDDLQRVLREGRKQLDPVTVDALERSLAIIDQAIRDARAALAQDPSDLYLSGHLVAARQRKLELLREASALIMEGI